MIQIRPGVVKCYNCGNNVSYAPHIKNCIRCGASFDLEDYEMIMKVNNLPEPRDVKNTSAKRIIRRVADNMGVQVRIRKGSSILLAAYLDEIAHQIADAAVMISKYENVPTVKARHISEAISEQPILVRCISHIN